MRRLGPHETCTHQNLARSQARPPRATRQALALHGPAAHRHDPWVTGSTQPSQSSPTSLQPVLAWPSGKGWLSIRLGRRRAILRTLADAVRTRRVSSHQLVERALERISRLDGHLNAVVALRADLALGEAQELDAQVAAGADPGPLAGIPVLVKDLEDVAGMRTTRGSALFADAPLAARDGLTPSRLRAAGAVVVGKTNLPEFATEGYSANLIFGATRNPWGLEWSPGGLERGLGRGAGCRSCPRGHRDRRRGFGSDPRGPLRASRH